MFRGLSSARLDEKGRLSMPTRFRDAFAQIDNSFTLTRHPHGCLMIFAPDHWAKFSAQLESVPLESQWMKRFFYGFSCELSLDKAGRVTLPSELREPAQMPVNAELLIMGMGNTIEIWERGLYAANEAKALAAAGGSASQIPAF